VCLNLLLEPAEFGVEPEAEPAENSEEYTQDEGKAASGEDDDTEDGADDEKPEAASESEAEADADARQADPLLLPDLPIATGPVGEEARKRTKSLLTEEIEPWQAARDHDRENLQRTNAPYFRDLAMAKSKPQSEGYCGGRTRGSGRSGGSQICL
jgi:hypothetical protein